MNIHEMYGRLAEQSQKGLEDLRQTLELLNTLKTGQVSLDDVHVTPTGWSIRPAGEPLPDNVVPFPNGS